MPKSTENPYTIQLDPAEAVLMHDVIEGTITSVDRDNKTVDVVLDEPYYPRNYETDYGKLEKHKKYEHLGIDPITEISGAKIIYNCKDEHEDPSNAFRENDKVLIVAVNEEYFCVGFPDEIRECAFYDILVVDIGTEWIPNPEAINSAIIKYNKAFFLIKPNYEIELLGNKIITKYLYNVSTTDFEFSIGNIQLSEQIGNDYLDVNIIYNSAGERKNCVDYRMNFSEIIIRDGDSIPSAHYSPEQLVDWLLKDGTFTFRENNTGIFRYSHIEGDLGQILTEEAGAYVCTDTRAYTSGCPSYEYTGYTITNEWECSEDTEGSSSGSGTNEDPYIRESTSQYLNYYLFRINDNCISPFPRTATTYSYHYEDSDKKISTATVTSTFEGCTNCDQYYSRNQACECTYQSDEHDATLSQGDYTLTRTFSGTTFGPKVDKIFCSESSGSVYYDFLAHYGSCNLSHPIDFQPQYPLKAAILNEWEGSCYEHWDHGTQEWTYHSELNITRHIYLEGQEISELTTTFSYVGDDPYTYKCYDFPEMAQEQYFTLSLAEVKHKIAAFYCDQTGYKIYLFHDGTYTDITDVIINSILSGEHAEIDGAPGVLRVRWQRGYEDDSVSIY